MSNRKMPWAFGVAALVAAAWAQPAAAQGALDRIQLHAYMSQAFVWASDTFPKVGISKNASTDYRRVALQLRFQVNDNDNLVLQLRHRRLGLSPIPAAEGSVAFDWGFFQHNFGHVQAQAGRVPMPRGLLNNIRDVGTIQPFYRAPYENYIESFETIDGVNFKARTDAGRWGLEFMAFGGQSPFLVISRGAVVSTASDQMAGGQIWVSPPIQGLKLGVQAARFRLKTGRLFTYARPGDESGRTYMFSGELNRQRFLLRSEYTYFSLGRDSAATTALTKGIPFRYRAYYVTAGVKPTDQLGFYVQSSHVQTHSYMALSPTSLKWVDPKTYDNAASVKYDVNSGLSLKFEGHVNKGYNYDVATVLPDAQGNLRPPRKENYFIASVAVAF